MGEKGVTLKDGVDVSLIGGQVAYILAHKNDVSLIGAFKAADEPQRGRFAAAGRAQQGEKLIVINIQIDFVQHQFSIKGLAYVFKLNYLLHAHTPK